ncbi:hypothetical protein [Nocardia yamanashiensis]|uniref:hypothetical protein n=1 Tax=Nocardia yamanashiensis TaxID=209247 RepID=UPI00083285B5|nr:hypothetical protein [Nocardia yamanashiensis]
MSAVEYRIDRQLLEFDVESALASGMRPAGADCGGWYTTAIIAAALRAEEVAIDSSGLAFLAGYVRASGLATVSSMPELFTGHAREQLVRGWIAAAMSGPQPVGVAFDDRFARWLDAVATVLSARERNRAPAFGAIPPSHHEWTHRR